MLIDRLVAHGMVDTNWAPFTGLTATAAGSSSRRCRPTSSRRRPRWCLNKPSCQGRRQQRTFGRGMIANANDVKPRPNVASRAKGNTVWIVGVDLTELLDHRDVVQFERVPISPRSTATEFVGTPRILHWIKPIQSAA